MQYRYSAEGKKESGWGGKECWNSSQCFAFSAHLQPRACALFHVWFPDLHYSPDNSHKAASFKATFDVVLVTLREGPRKIPPTTENSIGNFHGKFHKIFLSNDLLKKPKFVNTTHHNNKWPFTTVHKQTGRLVSTRLPIISQHVRWDNLPRLVESWDPGHGPCSCSRTRHVC